MTTDAIPDWSTLNTTEKMAIITPAWMDGKSANDIAWMFQGASRNAIIGMIHRQKLPTRSAASTPKPGIKPKPKIPKPPKPKKPSKPSAISATAFVSMPEPIPPTDSVMHMIENNRAPLAGTTPISILHLPNRPGVLCRFPVVGGYCGLSSGDKMYCPDHHRIVYRPAEGKFRMPKEARL